MVPQPALAAQALDVQFLDARGPADRGVVITLGNGYAKARKFGRLA